MSFLNVEIKARCGDPQGVRSVLQGRSAEYKGLDRQVDTYFTVPRGRLKLREGNIENSLIFYERNNQAGPKDSNVSLCKAVPDPALKEVLTQALGVIKTVDKRREIYFIGNVKFHIDQVQGLGSFVEIEAIDRTGDIGREKLLEQCRHFMQLLGISDKDLVTGSYSDMV
jgi:adenylate cyclase, class 2